MLRIPEIRSCLVVRNLDILCMVETRLKPDKVFLDNFFPGYSVYRHDRDLRRGGGVAIVARSDFCICPVLLSSEGVFQARGDILAEYGVFSVTSFGFPNFLICVIYRPPQSAHFSVFLDEIRDVLASSPRSVIVGDFNYNLLDAQSDGHDLLLSVSELDFSVLRFGPTFFHNLGESELDFCATLGVEVCEPVEKGEYPIPGGFFYDLLFW